VGGVADKEADTVRNADIISQRLYFTVRSLSSHISNVFFFLGLHSTCLCFSSYPLASDVGKTHMFAPTKVHATGSKDGHMGFEGGTLFPRTAEDVLYPTITRAVSDVTRHNCTQCSFASCLTSAQLTNQLTN
jgi:hypothetical protein